MASALAATATLAAVVASIVLEGEIQRNGQDSAAAWATAPVIITAIAMVAVLMQRPPREGGPQVLSQLMAGLLMVFYFLTGFSIGIAFVPALLLLVAAVIVASPPDP